MINADPIEFDSKCNIKCNIKHHTLQIKLNLEIF